MRPEIADESNEEGATAKRAGLEVFAAIDRADICAVRRLAPAANLSMRDERGQTALMRAAFLGRADCVGILGPLSDLAAQGPMSDAALAIAARVGQDECVKALLRLGADPKAKNKSGQTALMRATNLACARLLMPHSDLATRDEMGNTHLMAAAMGRSLGVVRLLLPQSDALAKNNKGWTALMWAVFNSRGADMVRLLAPSSDMEAKNDQGETAQAIAEKRGATAEAGFLLAMMERASICGAIERPVANAAETAFSQNEESQSAGCSKARRI